MKKLAVLTILFLGIFSKSIFAQATDYNGNDLFVVKSSSGTSFPIASSGVGFNHSIQTTTSNKSNNIRSYYFNPNEGDKITFNATDYGNWKHGVSFWGVNVGNLYFKSLSDAYSSISHPKMELTLGGIENSVISFNWDSLRKRAVTFLFFREHDFFYSVFIKSNLSAYPYYDTINNSRTVVDGWNFTKFSQVGANFNYTGYWTQIFALALTGKIYYGSYFDNDKSFQTNKVNPPINVGNTSFYSIGKPAGIYGGSLSANQGWKARLSVSFPVFFNLSKIFKLDSVSFYFLPSYANNFFLGQTSIHQFDFSINLLSKRYVNTHSMSSIIQGGGFGCEMISGQTSKGLSTPIWYFTGKLDLAKITKSKGVKKVQKHI